jgi:cbb3-type cytochrome oxidase subunit 3
MTVMAMTLVFIAGLYLRPRKHIRLSWLNCSLVLLFLAGAYFSFSMPL